MLKYLDKFQLVRFILVLFSFLSCVKESKDVSQKRPINSISFSDITLEAGLGEFLHDNGSYGEMLFPEQMGSGGGFVDYNGDGWLDILLAGGGSWNKKTSVNTSGLYLYKNNKNRRGAAEKHDFTSYFHEFSFEFACFEGVRCVPVRYLLGF